MWHREEGSAVGGSGGVGGQDTEGGMGSAEGRGYLIVSDGQKGGRAWKIPEQNGWYGEGGGGGGQSASDEQQMGRQPSKQ